MAQSRGISLRASALASAAIVALTLFVLALPELNKGFVRAEPDAVAKALERFTQPDLFALSTLDLGGRWRYVVKGYEEGVLEELYRPDAPLDGWSAVDVPFMFAATSRNSTIWLRRDFEVPSELRGYRIRLVFLGAFYKASVWLNGVYLGEHEGYFAPFYFDVGDLLNYGGSNTLVVCLSTPVELDLDNKQGVVGIFNDWDVKPYPRWALGKLPPRYEWVVPIGLWKPVVLAVSGPVAVSAVLVDSRYDGSTGSASLRVRLYVTNRGPAASCEVRYAVKPHNFEGGAATGSFSFAVDRGERRWVEAAITVPDAELWWTWDQGEPHLYRLEYEVVAGGVLQGRGSVVFGVRSLEGSAVAPNEARFVLNGRRVFLRGFNYVSDFYPVRSTRAVLERDLRMMVEAGANFVRVHAHVEPAEFYELASEMGLLVQADGPLIWAYASKLGPADYARFVERVQVQYAELVLLLYNYPSVAIWAVHNEPPWASQWMGDLYRRGVNRDLDYALAALIESLDSQRRPVIRGSGYEDQHVYYGWFSGSWTDFLKDASPFPTEFGAQSLPSLDSPFWSAVGTPEWPVRRGDSWYYELAYRGFYWASGYVKIPYGLPEEYPSLREYVEASQRYQALLLKTAIARYRALKFNPTAGFAVFLFRDCFPAVSFSVVDYFGVPKLAYRVASEMLKPTKVLLLWGGDFAVDGYRVLLEANSTLKAEIWLVNDATEASGPAVVEWQLVDINTGGVLDAGRLELQLPRADEPAVLVNRLSFKAPAYTDGAHLLELRASLSVGGRVVDEDSLEFVVKPASRVVVTLEGARQPLAFYVRSDRASFLVRSNGSTLSFTLPAGSRAVVLGPRAEGAVYVPVLLDLGALPPGTTTLSLRLVRGALYVLRTPMPRAGASSLPKLEVEIEPLVGLKGPYVLRYSWNDPEPLLALGLKGNELVVPAGVPLVLRCYVDGSLQLERLLNASPDQVYVDSELASRAAASSLEAGLRALSQARARLSWVERRGFYAGLTRQFIEEARALLDSARAAESSQPELAAALSQEAVSLLQSALARLNELYAGAAASLPALFLLVLLSSLGLTALVVEDDAKRPAVGAALLVALGVLIYLTYPGISEVGAMELFFSIYVSFFALVALLLLPHLLEGVRSEKGLPVFAAAASALSIAARNLRRRGFRTGLVLLSIAAMAAAVTSLSSLSYVVSARELVTAAMNPPNVDNALVAFSQRGMGLADALFVSSQPEVEALGLRVESQPRSEPYAYVAGRAVRAFLAVGGYLPVDLSGAVEPEGALEALASRSDVAIVSASWKSAGVSVGDTIEVSGVKLEVAGFFDPAALGRLRDIGGYDFLPQALYPDGSSGPAHPDEILLLPVSAALKLGGRVARVYAKTESPASLLSLARRLVLQAGYVVAARPAGDFLRVYFVGSRVEFRGWEALLPIALAFFNVASVVLASVYERRREIFTMASVGMNPTHIFLVFLSEAFLLGFVGGSLGYLAGVAAFRALQLAGARVPVDVKTGVADLAVVVSLSTLSAVAAAVAPALRASAYATPSLSRRWRLEAEVVGGEWKVEVPARVPADKALHFAEYLVERLREEEHGIERAVTGATLIELAEGGARAYEVRFTYSKGGGRPFNAQTRLLLRPVDREFYGITLLVKPLSVYARFSQSYVQEVAAFVRGIVLEWASTRVRLLAPVKADVSSVIELVRHYHPQLVILVSRRGDGGLVREIRSRLRSLGLRPPAIEVVTFKGASLDELVSEVRAAISRADIVALDSDDGVLSAALALAAALEGKRVSVLRDGRVEEASVDKLLRPAG
jgi:beta-mannosidase